MNTCETDESGSLPAMTVSLILHQLFYHDNSRNNGTILPGHRCKDFSPGKHPHVVVGTTAGLVIVVVYHTDIGENVRTGEEQTFKEFFFNLQGL